ncbi:MAG: putative selenium-dependent hydroxylase accessory protein YqeC, partial [Candidatus Neomarinimicrobiota bacterium]
VAFIGGGGKTSLILRLARELAPACRVLVTSLTKMGPIPGWEPVFLAEGGIPSNRPEVNPLYLLDRPLATDKFGGIDELTLHHLAPGWDLTLVEADGARRKPVKFHREPDPVLSRKMSLVLVVVGAEAVGQSPRTCVHRWEEFCSFWGLSPDQALSPVALARVVTDPEGYGSRIPEGVPISYFVNQADRAPQSARRLAEAIRARSRSPVYWGSVAAGWLEPVAGS